MRSCFIYMYSYAIRMSLVCTRMYSYVIRMSIVCTRMSSVCHSYILVCHPYLTRMYSYVIRMSLACTRMSFVCHSYVLVYHSYVTLMHSYVIRMSLVRTHMPSYVTRMYPYVIRISLVCAFTMNLHAILPCEETQNPIASESTQPNGPNGTNGKCHTGLMENHAAEMKKRTPLYELMGDGTEPNSILEQDIFQILELNEVKTSSPYRTSKQRFILVFGSEDSALQCQSTELSSVSSDVKVSLLFRERRGAPTFFILFCPEYISG